MKIAGALCTHLEVDLRRFARFPIEWRDTTFESHGRVTQPVACDLDPGKGPEKVGQFTSIRTLDVGHVAPRCKRFILGFSKYDENSLNGPIDVDSWRQTRGGIPAEIASLVTASHLADGTVSVSFS